MIDIQKYGIAPVGATPNERQLAHYKMGKKAFFHFGVNTFSGKEWGNGTEQEQLFDPSQLDTDQWIKIARDSGFKLAIITAKHHDGFCLWPSKYTEHSVKNSPYKEGNGDVIREFTDSCRKYGIKAGIYISPWDRYSPYWGSDEYSDYFANQLTELLTQYGEIHEVWWDGAGSAETRYDWALWESIVRKYQSKAAIFGSLGAAEHVDLRWVGNERGFAGKTHYASIDPEYLLHENPAMLNMGQLGGKKYIPSETDVSIRPGWFYHANQDDAVKSPAQLNKIWFESVGRNSMMLLNFPPDQRGLVCRQDWESALASHECISKMLSKNLAHRAQILGEMEPFSVEDPADGEVAEIYPGKVVDIRLPHAEKINVFALSELVEAGERVAEFTLESVDEAGNTALLYAGISIGFYRAIQIPEGMYKHLRLTVKNALAQPLLKNFGLHYFEDAAPAVDEKVAGNNIVKDVEIKDDGKTIVAAFGGIFPFNRVEFKVGRGSAYQVEAFNGSDYYKIAEGIAQEEKVKFRFSASIEGSYQIRIQADSPVAEIVATQVCE